MIRAKPVKELIVGKKTHRKSLNKYSIKGLSKDHPAQKEFNKYMKGKEAKE